MKTNKGFVGIAIAILVGLALAVGGVSYYVSKNNNLSKNTPNEIFCNENSKPSITVLAPNGGETYIVGQKVDVKWTSCNVKNVYLGLVSDGKDFGLLSEKSIPATTGSFQWIVSNPAKDFT